MATRSARLWLLLSLLAPGLVGCGYVRGKWIKEAARSEEFRLLHEEVITSSFERLVWLPRSGHFELNETRMEAEDDTHRSIRTRMERLGVIEIWRDAEDAEATYAWPSSRFSCVGDLVAQFKPTSREGATTLFSRAEPVAPGIDYYRPTCCW